MCIIELGGYQIWPRCLCGHSLFMWYEIKRFIDDTRSTFDTIQSMAVTGCLLRRYALLLEVNHPAIFIGPGVGIRFVHTCRILV